MPVGGANMTYVQNLRKLVGHMPLELPGTGLIIFKKCGDKLYYLLQHRTDNGKFGLLGGGIELHETYRHCANRELYEESGLFTQEEEFKLQDVYAGERHITIHPNGDEVHHTVVVFSIDYYKCSYDTGELDNESKGVVWCDEDTIKELLAQNKVFPNNAPILEDLIDGKFHF